ncbi:hypothetical protein AUC70_09065 [Methyloceanibacter stevinii]|uniref:Uncharacterized protein n=1 Tax=Methyloceanibacter stevinii TaxID=1774970 RepID=A0A1E3VJS3_9HYPH|nr:hypothetical protein [Methyloceanibacter stevinii]ODR93790.1 hypothetical protein AUC70_09065 [Methyloceanibacter stevinii]
MANGEGGLSDFLHTQSMITPGAAGGLTLTITNTVGNVFHLPLGYVALGVSALFGVVILAVTATAPVWQRCAFFVINTLIIFCVAMGSNAAGQQIVHARTQTASFSLFGSAHAQSPEAEDEASKIVEEVEAITRDSKLTAQQKVDDIAAELEAGESADTQSDSLSGSKGFFQTWGF